MENIFTCEHLFVCRNLTCLDRDESTLYAIPKIGTTSLATSRTVLMVMDSA